jgi:hypothetical protein
MHNDRLLLVSNDNADRLPDCHDRYASPTALKHQLRSVGLGNSAAYNGWIHLDALGRAQMDQRSLPGFGGDRRRRGEYLGRER